MIAKLICHGPDRKSAIDKLVKSLKNYQVVGMPNNISFVEKVANHPVFRKGGVTTAFLTKYADDVQIKEGTAVSRTARALAAVTLALSSAAEQQQSPAVGGGKSPWSSLPGSWRLHGHAARPVTFSGEGGLVKVHSNRDGSFTVDVAGGASMHVHQATYDKSSSKLDAWVGDRRFAVSAVVTTGNEGETNVNMWSLEDGKTFEGHEYYASLTVPAAASTAGAGAGAGGAVKSPMPGKVVAVNKKEGDVVSAGDVVMILEAMKMEHPIFAPVAGVVGSVASGVGDLVGDGNILFVISPPKK
jgi:3-methylcrotonyl-CoA carboxylase alpha subunit